jgi:hypothetical protein
MTFINTDKDSVSMSELCGCPPEVGNTVCDLPAQNLKRSLRAVSACPECSKTGKAIQGQTVKSLLSVSLRQLQGVQYLFCRTQTCPVVYFSVDSEQIFKVEQVRERVYQKEPEAKDISVCYCFRHTVGEFLAALPKNRMILMEDIKTGINAGQCACDVRNPQGSCCLGNIRRMIKQLEKPAFITT